MFILLSSLVFVFSIWYSCEFNLLFPGLAPLLLLSLTFLFFFVFDEWVLAEGRERFYLLFIVFVYWQSFYIDYMLLIPVKFLYSVDGSTLFCRFFFVVYEKIAFGFSLKIFFAPTSVCVFLLLTWLDISCWVYELLATVNYVWLLFSWDS